MKTSILLAVVLLLSVSGSALDRRPDREIGESLGTSFGDFVKERPAIVARMNGEMDQLTAFCFTPEVAAGLSVVLEPGDDTRNTNGYWIHLHGMNSLWQAIGMARREELLTLLAHRYQSLADAAKAGGDISKAEVAPLADFLTKERKAVAQPGR